MQSSGETQNLGYVSKGNNLIDEACDEDKGNVFLIQFRIGDALGFPDFLYANRVDIIKSDLKYLQDLDSKGKLTEEESLTMTFDKSNILMRDGKVDDARRIWKMIIGKYPDHQLAIQSKKLLDENKNR